MSSVSRSGAVAVAVLVFGAVAGYHNIFENSFHYDDEHSILHNPHIRSLANIPSFFVDPGTFSGLTEARMYRPLLLATYAVNYAAGGYEVWGYHLVNFLFHLFNALLLRVIILRFVADRRVALYSALLFLLHPAMTESVNYISSRSSLMATLFCLLSLSAMTGSAAHRGRGVLWVSLSYAAALASKSIAFVWMGIAAIYLWTRPGKFPGPTSDPEDGLTGYHARRLLILPVGLSVGYLLLTRSILDKALVTPVRSHAVQWATQIKAVPFYLKTLVMPTALSVEPQFVEAGSFVDPAVLAAGGLMVTVVLVAAKTRMNAVAQFGLIWSAIALLPSSLVPLHVLVNEHRLYFPFAGAAVPRRSVGWASCWSPSWHV